MSGLKDPPGLADGPLSTRGGGNGTLAINSQCRVRGREVGTQQDPDDLSLVRIWVARHAAENNAPVSKDSGRARRWGGPDTAAVGIGIVRRGARVGHYICY